MRFGDFFCIAEVGFAHLQEVAAAREQTQGRVGEILGQAVQNEIHSGAASLGQEFMLEVGVSGGGDVRFGKSEVRKEGPFGGTGGCEYFDADVTGKLQGGHSGSAGCGVDENPLSLA